MKPFSRHEKGLLWIAGLMLVLTFLFFPLFDRISAAVNGLAQEEDARLVKEGLLEEMNGLLRESERLSSSMQDLLREENVLDIFPALEDERKERGLGFLIAVDEGGAVLARTHDLSRRRDLVFETASWSGAAASGADISAFGEEEPWPFAMVASRRNGGGRIVAGHGLDDAYAASFRERRMPSGAHVAFYSRLHGVSGSSFEDASARELLAAYFHSGSNWIQAGRSGDMMKLNGRYYLVRNIPLPASGVPGGALVFSPMGHSAQSASLAALVVILYLLAVYFVSRRSREKFLKKHWALLAANAAVLFGLAFVINQLILDGQALRVERQPYIIYNSTLRLEPGQGIFETGADQRIAVLVDTGGEAVNAVGIVLAYDSDIVRVKDILMNNSFCDPDFVIERTVDPEAGEVRVSCGLPNPGFSGKTGTIAEILLSPAAQGQFALRFSEDTQVLANDGLGTNVLRAAEDGSYWILEPEAPVNPLAAAIPVFSRTHPDSEIGYNNPSVEFSWPRSGNFEYVYKLDRNPSSSLAGLRPTRDKQARFQAEEDGVYYFHIAARRDGVLGPVTRRKAIVDTTRPSPPLIRASASEIRAGEVVRFDFAVDRRDDLRPAFYFKINDGLFLPVGPQVYVPFADPGRHTVTVRVFDRAGNFTDAHYEVNAAAGSFFDRVFRIDFQSLFN